MQNMIAAFEAAETHPAKAVIVAKAFGLYRNDVMRATQASMRAALESNDASLLITKDGKPLTAPPSAVGGDLAEVIARAIEGRINPGIDREAVEAILDEKLSAELAKFGQMASKRIEVALPDGSVRNVGRQHEMFPKLVRLLGLRLNVYLKGPAGSGKTTAAEKAAEALGLAFYCQSMGPQTSQANLLGYMDANGNYVPGLLYKPFTEGGVVCIDEIDNSNAGVVTVLNSALSNGYCSFPCGMAQKHRDFVVVAAGNTYGKGADALYVGRTQLDAATLNRFAVLDWGYDEAFELDLVGNDQKDWTLYVQKVRFTAERLKMRVVVSPRQSMMGASMLRAGFDRSEVEDTVLWASMNTDDRNKLRSAAA
jgi:hypothetical protein